MKLSKGKSIALMVLAVAGLVGCSGKSPEEGMYSEAGSEEGQPETVKQTVVLGCMEASADLKRMINEFNVENDTWQIECQEYGYDDDALQRVRTEFVTGDGPDLISLNMIEVEEYTYKGVLEDLAPYLAQSTALQREDLVESVLLCNTIEGKLICIPPNYAINTLMGKESEVGAESGWTIEQFMSYVKKHEGAEIFEGATAGESQKMIVIMNLQTQMDHYIDWESGTVSFNTPDFLELIEFAGAYKSPYYDANKPTSEKIKDDSVLLYNRPLTDMESYLYTKEIFNNDISFKGYPTESGNAWYGLYNYEDFALRADSQCKEGAWSFLEYMILKQETDKPSRTASFPILKRALEDMFERSSEQAWHLDENGREVLNPITERSDGGASIKIYPATQEDVDQVRKLIDGVKYVTRSGSYAESIVLEELDSYFSEQKTADETVQMIQSRIDLYVKEQL